jgi:hypothetical protein
MANKLAVFVGDQRQRQGAAGARPFDDPTLSLVAVGMIGGCASDHFDLNEILEQLQATWIGFVVMPDQCSCLGLVSKDGAVESFHA